MLQQTQAERVVPHYERFVAAFPTPGRCAEAGPGEVVRQWSGLGYNRRALNLQRAAVAIVDEHAGTIPTGDAALRALPGVGAYTARAVRDMLPKAHFATVYAKPMGRPLVDTFITEVSQDTWIFFPWDTALSFQPPIRDGAA